MLIVLSTVISLEVVYCPDVTLAHADELDGVRLPLAPRYRLLMLLVPELG